MKFKYLSIIGLLAIVFAGCGDVTTEGVSRVTNYPSFTLNGDEVMYHQLGADWTDPGCTAEEAGKSLTVTTSTMGVFNGETTLNKDVADEYHITYSATNADGFAGSVGRTVYVVNNGDLVSSIEGLYTSTVVRNGVASAQYTDMAYVIISKNSDGTYSVSDGIGAYYAIGRGYGNGYGAPGLVVTANDISTNDFSFTPFSVTTFGGTCETTSMTVDAGAKTINFVTEWSAGYTFDVTLTQVSF